jgi:transcriptional regulator with XRE-family HTH domain
MAKINIGTYIAAKRKEKGLTQEELALYLGVSKPAVSKWESGQSYPDILLLPVLASYFNTSVDELIGYEAQLTKADVSKLYKKLAAAFASEPFGKVYEECREHIRKYHSCWNLLLAIGQLLINHSMLAGSPEKMNDILREASALFEHVEKDSNDARLAKDAMALRAYCCIALGKPAGVIDLLDDYDEQHLSVEILLAKAYAMRGDGDKANGILQRFIFTNGINIFAAMPDFMALYAGNTDKLDACLKLALEVAEAFEFRKILPHLYFTLYLTAAALYASVPDTGKALDMLEAYTDIATDCSIYPLKLRDSSFFDRLAQYYDTQSFGNFPPRSEILIKKDLKDVVLNSPAFFGLMQEERFRRLLQRLEHIDD